MSSFSVCAGSILTEMARNDISTPGMVLAGYYERFPLKVPVDDFGPNLSHQYAGARSDRLVSPACANFRSVPLRDFAHPSKNTPT